MICSGRLIVGDCIKALQSLPDASVHTCVTSPPYWGLRDYGVEGQLGLEKTPDEYVARMVEVFREVRRVLRDDGTLWLNLGDSYATSAGTVGNCPGGGKQGEIWRLRGKMTPPNRMPIQGLKPKDLVGIPWRVAFALQANGWYLRQDIIWHKPNPMPESVRDRCTKAHEYIFLLAKSERYRFDSDAIKERAVSSHAAGNKKHKYVSAYAAGVSEEHRTKGGLLDLAGRKWETRNRRSVWTVTTKPFRGAHFATFPPDLIEPCVLAGAPVGGVVLDPFMGAGTTGLVAARNGRSWIGCELNPEYAEMAKRRIEDATARVVQQEEMFTEEQAGVTL